MGRAIEAAALRTVERAANTGNLLLAYSGGKDSLALALLMRGRFTFRAVCETSFYFERAEADIRNTASALGLAVDYRMSLGLDWIRRNPQIVFSDDPDVRAWTFAHRHQRTVAREQRTTVPGATYAETRPTVAVFGRRTQENTVRGDLYQTRAGWQAHPLRDWREEDVWRTIDGAGVPRPWIYSTRFGRFEGNAPFYTLRARDVGGREAAWRLVQMLDPRFSYHRVFVR